MKIYLSIDFDFWVKPRDPINLAEIGRYSDSGEGWILRYLHYDIEKWKISGIPTPFTLFDMLKKRLNFNINEIYVTDSHKEAYHFFKNKDSQALIIHLDSHSDQEPTSKLYCGNWISFLSNPILWIYPEWVYPNHFYYDKNRTKVSTLRNLNVKGTITDIFICRSGGWVPPHLDSYFFKFAKKIERLGKTIYNNINKREFNLKKITEERKKWIQNYI